MFGTDVTKMAGVDATRSSLLGSASCCCLVRSRNNADRSGAVNTNESVLAVVKVGGLAIVAGVACGRRLPNHRLRRTDASTIDSLIAVLGIGQ